MKLGTQKTDAVSPVIATILLIAVTIVLVMLVAAIMMGMIGDPGNAKSVGVTVETFSEKTGGEEYGVYVTVFGGKDAGSLVNLTIGFRDDMVFELDGTSPPTNVISNPAVGIVSKMKVRNKGGGGIPNPLSGPITVIGRFQDGTSQVLYQKTITLEKK